MRINEFVEADFDMDYRPGLDKHGMELDKDDGDMTNFKQEAMQVQLMRIEDSVEDDDIKNPVRSVVTSDNKKVRVEHHEAVAILKALKSPTGKPEQKLQLQKKIQDSAGLVHILNILRKKK